MKKFRSAILFTLLSLEITFVISDEKNLPSVQDGSISLTDLIFKKVRENVELTAGSNDQVTAIFQFKIEINQMKF